MTAARMPYQPSTLTCIIERRFSMFIAIACLAVAAASALASPTSTAPCEGSECQTQAVTVAVTTMAPAPTAAAAKKPTTFENAPVVPTRICTFKGQRCLNKASTEFVNTVLEFDDIASFVLTAEGLLYRLDDGRCAQAVSKDNGAWYDLEFVACEVPEYVSQALDIEGVAAPASTSTAKAPEGEASVWRYNSKTERLCAGPACMYSDEGYVLLGTKAELSKLPARSSAITMPLVVPSGQSLTEHILNMLKAMTYDGTVFWASAWDTNVVSVVQYKLLAAKEKDIDFNADIAPLWQVINTCRQECDATEWCHSFSFPVQSRVCTLSAAYPKLDKGAEGDVVVFVQNDKYNREDYVLDDNSKE